MAANASINLIHPYMTRCRDESLFDIFKSRKIIVATIFASIVVHAIFLVHVKGLDQHESMNQQHTYSVDIVLNKYIPESVPKQKATPIKKEIVKKPLPSPVKKTTPLPAETKSVVEEEKIEDIKNEEIVEEVIVEEQLSANQIASAPDNSALIQDEKELYLQTIAAHLEKHKYYPRSAKRRNIEGQVKVSFELMEDGNILNLHTFSGHSLLQKATSESIHSALPMPPRPESLLALSTIPIEYTMEYVLRD